MTRRRGVLGNLIGVLGGSCLLALAMAPTFGHGWLWVTVLGSALLGWAIAVAGWRRGWGSGRSALVVLGAWFTLGGPLCMPSTLLWGMVPSGATLRGLALAPVTAPKVMLGFEPPIGEVGNLLCVPAMLALSGALAAGIVTLRSRRSELAWLPMVGSIVVAQLLGTGRQPRVVAWSLALGVLALVWSSAARAGRRSRLVRERRHRGYSLVVGSAVLLPAIGVTALLAPWLRPAQRPWVVRDAVQPPLAVHEWPSPLLGFRRNVQTEHAGQRLFTIEGNLPEGAVVRLATLDLFDGLSYRVAAPDEQGQARFKRVGSRIAQDGAVDASRVDVRVRVDALGGHWVPTIGNVTGLVFEGDRARQLGEGLHHDRFGGVAVDAVALQAGDVYRLGGLVPTRPSEAQIAAAKAGGSTMPQVAVSPSIVDDLAAQWRGEATGGAAALRLQQRLREGWFSHGQSGEAPSAPGHSSARVRELLERSQLEEPSMVGDDEQYAVAMALLANASGIPARVVQGYRIGAPRGGVVEVTGADAGAWAELQLDGLGWVLFDPTPPRERRLSSLPPDDAPPPDSHVDDPQTRPTAPVNPPPDDRPPSEQTDAPAPDGRVDWRVVGRWTAAVALPLVLLVAPLVVVVLGKWRRRRARRRASLAANRVAGSWAEVLDRARDLGADLPPSATRSEQAEHLVRRWPAVIAHSDPIGVAKGVDHEVFRPEPVTDAEARAAWARSVTVESALRRSLPRWRWVRALVSARSLRRQR